jgi:hypothetical protein
MSGTEPWRNASIRVPARKISRGGPEKFRAFVLAGSGIESAGLRSKSAFEINALSDRIGRDFDLRAFHAT